MKTARAALLAAVLILGAPLTAIAVQPDEVLSDPVLEARARAISAELRCMVCQNQSIDDSDAELARDLRVVVRERLQAGDTDGQVADFVVSRYGEFVLLKPRFNARNALLWSAPLLILVIGGLFLALRRRGTAGKPAEPLSRTEEKRLKDILGG
jgi:cytochrome c-type biogenesis protein CcmH